MATGKLIKEGGELVFDTAMAIKKELANRIKQGDSLAMDYASRMARAKETGFNKAKYHTTTSDIESFNRGTNSEARSGKGIYTADTPKYGNLRREK